MKQSMTQYNDYIKGVDEHNLHPYLNDLYTDIPFENIRNTIFYGKKGIGKYSQVLNIIRKFSKSNLNYLKKVIIPLVNKDDYVIKISDIHYEVDMNLLGCNSRTLWNDIYNQIIEIIMSSQEKKGIILCKNFEKIIPELQEIFYCFVNEIRRNINVKFFFISSNISFILPSMLNDLEIIALKPPNNKEMKKLQNTIYSNNYKCKITDELYSLLIQTNEDIDLFQLRENLYNLLLFQIDIYETLYNILERLSENDMIDQYDLYKINIKIVDFCKLYNNNYRPIFHLERIALYIYKIVCQKK